MLSERNMAAGEIAAHFAMSKPSVSYHLDLLKQAGLVSSLKDGQFVRYSLETAVLAESSSWILGLLGRAKDDAGVSPAHEEAPVEAHARPSLLLDLSALE